MNSGRGDAGNARGLKVLQMYIYYSYRQKWPRAEAEVSYSQQRGGRRFDGVPALVHH